MPDSPGKRPAGTLHLAARHRAMLEALLQEHLPEVEVWAYGSRVNGESHDGSDLDLVLRGPGLAKIDISRLVDFEEALRDSTVPFLVEAHDWARLPERFHQEIERNHIVIWMNKRPCDNDWIETSLGQVIELKCGYNLPASVREEGSVPVVSSSGITGYHSKGKTCGPGVVTGRYGTLGRVFYMRGEYWPLNTALYVSDFKGNDPRFISYLLKGVQFLTYSDKSAVPGLNRNHLHQEIVRVPKRVSEQRAIGYILGALDDKIELNRRMNETLDAMVRALFKSWFVDFDPVYAKMEERNNGLPQCIANLFPDRMVETDLGLMPVGWDSATLADIVSLNPESWSKKRHPAILSYVDIAHTKWGNIRKIETFSWNEAPSRARRVLRRRDTILATVRPENGSYALIGQEGLTGSTGFAVLRPREATDRAIVWCATTSSANIDRLSHLADGGAYPAIRPKEVASTPIILADLAVRTAFACIVDPLLDKVDSNTQESRMLGALRDGFLPEMISGGLQLASDGYTDRRAIDV